MISRQTPRANQNPASQNELRARAFPITRGANTKLYGQLVVHQRMRLDSHNAATVATVTTALTHHRQLSCLYTQL